jgi:hypothetical protein
VVVKGYNRRMEVSPFTGPLSIRDRVSPCSKYEAECPRCSWSFFDLDYVRLTALLRGHIENEHIRIRSLEEMLSAFSLRSWIAPRG